MKGAIRFTIMFLAIYAFGFVALPTQAVAGASVSISVDAYPIRFAFSDTQPERVYVEREARHYHCPDCRPTHYSGGHRQVYHVRGYDRPPCHHHGRYHARWHGR